MTYFNLIQDRQAHQLKTDEEVLQEIISCHKWQEIATILNDNQRIIRASVNEEGNGIDMLIFAYNGNKSAEIKYLGNGTRFPYVFNMEGFMRFSRTLQGVTEECLRKIKELHEEASSHRLWMKDLILQHLVTFMQDGAFRSNWDEVEFTKHFTEFLKKKGVPAYHQVGIDTPRPIRNLWTDSWQPDILIRLGDTYFPIEFKYRFVNHALSQDAYYYYDFWKDVYKLQQLKQCNDFTQGMSIFVAKKAYFDKTLSSFVNKLHVNAAGDGRCAFDLHSFPVFTKGAFDIEVSGKKVPMCCRSYCVE